MSTRAELQQSGEAMRRRLFGDAGDGGPEIMRSLNTEAVFGAVWSRPGLAIEDRMVCSLAALGALQRLSKLRRYVGAALDLDLSTRSIVEILIMIGLYAGFAASEEAVETAGAVFDARGLAMPEEIAGDDSLEALSERGHDLMRQLHGDRATKGYAAPDDPVTSMLYPLAIQYGYGEIWFRPGLDLRQRALVAVAAFTALKMDPQIAKFGQAAVNMGLSRTEVIEAVIQTAPLSGFAPALNALARLSGPFSK